MKISKHDVLDWLEDEDFDPDEKFGQEHKNRRHKFRNTQTGDNKKQGRRQIQEERNAKKQLETIYEID